MHLRAGTDETRDSEGIDYPSLEAMRTAAMTAARDCIAGDVLRGIFDLRFRIDAEDERGQIVYTLPFGHAVSIIPENIDPDAEATI
jgi:hypothetical protein